MRKHYSKQAREFAEIIHQALSEAVKKKPKSYKGCRLMGFVLIEADEWARNYKKDQP